MTKIHTEKKIFVAELRSFEEQWFNFESGFSDAVTTPTIEVGDFDYNPIKEVLDIMKFGIPCILPRFLKGDSQYKTPVEYSIVNLNPELQDKFQFDQKTCTLLVEEPLEWIVEIRPYGEENSSVQHSFKPKGRSGGVWFAHRSYSFTGNIPANLPGKNGNYEMDKFRSHIDFYENERLVDRMPVRYPLEELFPYEKNQVSMFRGDQVFCLPKPDFHHESLRWFSSENIEVTQHEPREVSNTLYYLKGWCRDTEQWIQVIDEQEAPVTWNIIVNDWSLQSIIDAIQFQFSADAQGVFWSGKWNKEGAMPSVVQLNKVTAKSNDGFSVDILEHTIEIRCTGIYGFSTSVEFQVDGFDDVAKRTFEFPPDRNFDGEALDCISITLITRDCRIVAIDYNTTDLREGLTNSIRLSVGTNYALEIYPDEHKTIQLDSALQIAPIFAEPSWHPYGWNIKHELTKVTEKVTKPSQFSSEHKKYIAWHPELVNPSNHASHRGHLISANTELELNDIHDIERRPILFQFHEDGQTTVYKLLPFDITYEEPQPYYIVYDEGMNDLNTLQINDDEFQNGEKFFGPKGGLFFDDPGHYIVAIQPSPQSNVVLRNSGKVTANHEPLVDEENWHFGRRYTSIVCIEVV